MSRTKTSSAHSPASLTIPTVLHFDKLSFDEGRFQCVCMNETKKGKCSRPLRKDLPLTKLLHTIRFFPGDDVSLRGLLLDLAYMALCKRSHGPKGAPQALYEGVADQWRHDLSNRTQKAAEPNAKPRPPAPPSQSEPEGKYRQIHREKYSATAEGSANDIRPLSLSVVQDKLRFFPYKETLFAMSAQEVIKKSHNRVHACITERLCKTARLTGVIYIFTRSQDPGLVKFGFTTKTAKERAAELGKKCHYTADLKWDSGPLPHAFFVESVVQRELELYRRKERRCRWPRCTTQHQEWFEIAPHTIIQVIGRWVKWIRDHDPWLREPEWTLKPEWQTALERYIEAVDNGDRSSDLWDRWFKELDPVEDVPELGLSHSDSVPCPSSTQNMGSTADPCAKSSPTTATKHLDHIPVHASPPPDPFVIPPSYDFTFGLGSSPLPRLTAPSSATSAWSLPKSTEPTLTRLPSNPFRIFQNPQTPLKTTLFKVETPHETRFSLAEPTLARLPTNPLRIFQTPQTPLRPTPLKAETPHETRISLVNSCKLFDAYLSARTGSASPSPSSRHTIMSPSPCPPVMDEPSPTPRRSPRRVYRRSSTPRKEPEDLDEGYCSESMM